MTKEDKRYVYRICPCDPYDIEGLQSWLEDLALEGLFPEDDPFCGIFTFERDIGRKVIYRLDAAQKQKPGVFGGGDELSDEEIELYRAMGWEYVLRYRDFRVYRSIDQSAPELNTEPEIHAMTIALMKKRQRSSLMTSILTLALWLLASTSFLRYFHRNAAALGLIFTLCAYGLLLGYAAPPFLRMMRLRRYEKRLSAGDALNRRVNWRKNAAANYCSRALPVALSLGIVFGLVTSIAHMSEEKDAAAHRESVPFATVLDAFPGGRITEENSTLDYNSFTTWSNACAVNYEWNESVYATDALGDNYFCILRLEYHETRSEQFAKGLEKDYYVYDSTRHHGKRFEDLEAPELGVDSVRVYSSYGSLYVLMRHGSRVAHAVVVMDNRENQNQWLLWAQAMAANLK